MAQIDHTPPSKNGRPVVLQARDLDVAFPSEKGDHVVVSGFSLEIRKGEFIGLVGSTGSGKSVAARSLIGLPPPPGKIVRGEIEYMGRNLRDMGERELRGIRGKEIGLITQSPHAALNPLMHIGDQIANIYRAHNRVAAAEARERAVEMLELVGINDAERRMEAYPHELSGGMAQRVLIAIALSSRPPLLIADEPSSGLDVTVQAQILDDMWESVSQTGSAVLLVTSDLSIVANYCDRVVVMHKGKIVEQAEVRKFFREPKADFSKSILSLQRGESIQSVEEGEQESRRTTGGQESEPPLLDIRKLTKHFPISGSKSYIQAVSDLSFEVRRGETLGLVGESGSGKTTTGRCILRLEKPTSGEIRYRGGLISAIPDRQLRQYRSKLQIVFQDPFQTLDPRRTVAESIREPLDLHTKLGKREKATRVLELMSLTGLEAALGPCLPIELTAGSKQRVSLARALATNPEFIVLDEPTSALAPDAENEIIHLLIDLQRKLGLSYLFISHDLSLVKYLCHRVAVMYLSQIVEIGTKDQVFNSPRHPYSQALLNSVIFPDPSNRRVDRSEEERVALKGEIPSPINLPTGCYLCGRCKVETPKCREEKQVLRPLADGRQVRCWCAE